MLSKQTYLLTGGTGFLGIHLARELFKKGHKVIFLGRSQGSNSLRNRIYEKLSKFDLDLKPGDIIAYEINFSKDNLGLSAEIINFLKGNITATWHLAADLSFKRRDRIRVFDINVHGLSRLLKLINIIGGKIFYVSTAYVHGKRSGIIMETELIQPRYFNNVYEESKFEGEKLINSFDKIGNRSIIFRPSILVESKSTGFTDFGFYSVISQFTQFKKHLINFSKKFPMLAHSIGIQSNDSNLKIPLFFVSKSCLLNVMPVAIATKWMTEIVEAKKALGKTFHITNPQPFPIKNAMVETFQALSISTHIYEINKNIMRFGSTCIQIFGKFITAIRPLSRVLKYYGYYIIEYNYYDMTNIRKLIGKKIETDFEKIGPGFIENLTKEFLDLSGK